MDCPHSTPDAWQEGRNPNDPILRATGPWKGGRFAGNPGTRRTGARAGGALCWVRFLRSLTPGFVGEPANCRSLRKAQDDQINPGARTIGKNDGYYEVNQQVCIDRRSSRLLWGSGNARRNRMESGCKACAGFPNPDTADVGALEKASIGQKCGLNLQRRPQAGTRNAQRRLGGWVEIWAQAASAAEMQRRNFPRQQDRYRGLQCIHRRCKNCGGTCVTPRNFHGGYRRRRRRFRRR